jgi:hypothetical protein
MPRAVGALSAWSLHDAILLLHLKACRGGRRSYGNADDMGNNDIDRGDKWAAPPAPPPATPVSVAVVERHDGRPGTSSPAGSGQPRRGWPASGQRRAGDPLPRRRAGEGRRPTGHHRSGALCRRSRAGQGPRRGGPGEPQPRQNRARSRPSPVRSHAISHQELDTRENAYANAQAALQQASAALE